MLGINRDEQKISLGIRQLETNPWDQAMEKYPPGTKVKGKIRNLTSYGAFIELEEGLDGMIHVSDISWTRKINHPSEVFKKGDEVEAVVLEIDKANQRIACGVKQLSDDPWDNIDKFYKVGDLVTGKVTKLASFGAFVGLQHDIDGLVHISQVTEDRVDKIKNVLKVDQEVTARVIKIDRAIAASVSRSKPPATPTSSSRKSRRCSTHSNPAKTSLPCNTPSTRPTTWSKTTKNKSRIQQTEFRKQNGRTGNSPPIFLCAGTLERRRPKTAGKNLKRGAYRKHFLEFSHLHPDGSSVRGGKFTYEPISLRLK